MEKLNKNVVEILDLLSNITNLSRNDIIEIAVVRLMSDISEKVKSNNEAIKEENLKYGN